MFRRMLAMQNGRANHAIDTTNNAEFLCPLCKRLSNILVPAIPYAYEKIPGDKHEGTTKHALPADISVPEYSDGLEAQITEKIKFSNGGAEAELLRFISTISNNRYRLEDPSRIHKKIDMLYLLWNAGSYTLSNFANVMFEQDAAGHNSFEIAAKLIKFSLTVLLHPAVSQELL